MVEFFGYLFLLRRTSPSSASLYIGSSGLGLHQDSLFVRCQILHLDCEISKQGNVMQSVLFVPVQNVLLLEFIRIFSNILAARESVTLLDML